MSVENFHHRHNLVNPDIADAERAYGIRVSLPLNDALTKVLGADWERTHWFASEQERDDVLADMAKRHGYYRDTDTPTQILEKVNR